MKNYHLILPLLFALLTGTAASQTKSDEFFTRVLEADGVTSQEDIQKYRTIYDQILAGAKAEIDPEDNAYDKNEDIFDFLHDSYLEKYTEDSRFTGLLDNKEYNCVTSVILYYLLSTDIGTDITLNESAFHVYITASEEGREYIIDLTDPSDGFDYEWDKENYVEELLRYKIITREELAEKGTNAIYTEFVAKSHKITPVKLLAAYYSNLAVFSVKANNYPEAYRAIKKAVILNPDSMITLKHNLIWSLWGINAGDDADSLTAFVLATMDTIPASDDFRETMISVCGDAIQKNMAVRNFDRADSVYRKLCSVLPEEQAAGRQVKEYYRVLNTEKAKSFAVRGEYDTAFAIMTDLIIAFPENDNVLDIYIGTGSGYMNQLAGRGEYDKTAKTAALILKNAPGIESVKDNYAQAVTAQVMRTDLCRTNNRKAEQILLDAYEKVPGSYGLKQALAYVYHEQAMAEIRNTRDYRKAIDLLNEGLKYDPDNYDLKKELIWTKELVK